MDIDELFSDLDLNSSMPRPTGFWLSRRGAYRRTIPWNYYNRSLAQKQRFKAVWASNEEYQGLVFSWKVESTSKRLLGYVYGLEVYSDGQNAHYIKLPTNQELEEVLLTYHITISQFLNRVRLFWRNLDISAVRYKNTTRINLNNITYFINPGESLCLHPTL